MCTIFNGEVLMLVCLYGLQKQRYVLPTLVLSFPLSLKLKTKKSKMKGKSFFYAFGMRTAITVIVVNVCLLWIEAKIQ